MAFVSVSGCVCVSMHGNVCVWRVPFYLMTNRIEGSEQSGLNDYYGNEGERLIGREREGKETKLDYRIY